MNESVDNILSEMREDDVRIAAAETPKTEALALRYACDWIKGYADRIEAAHKREIEELKEERNRAKLNAIAELRKREVRRNFDRFATVDEARRAYELESGKTFNEHCAKCPWCPDDTTYARFVHWLFGNTAKEYWEDK